MKKSIFSIFATGLLFAGCHNSNIDHPDYEYQTISFAYPSPIRTITLGYEADTDNSDDNAHRFNIKATLGGVNENRADHSATFRIAEELCENLYFDNGDPVLPMPDTHYSISTDRLVISKGNVLGGFTVQLTDAYFADPKSIDVNYVIPVLLVNSADSILQGKAKEDFVNPSRLNSDAWSIMPKDFTLYAVKYKNKVHGCWLSKGTDKVNDNGSVKTVDRMAQYWEKASLRYLRTKGLNKASYLQEIDVPTIDVNGEKSEKHLTCQILLDIAENGAVTVSTDTPDCTASGSGSWTSLGEPKAFGDRDRDLLKLDYTYRINYVVNDQTGERAFYEVSTKEDMVLRDRENKLEWFNYHLK